MSRACLECGICVGDRHASVVVQMNLDIAANNAAESTNEVIDLTGVCTTDSVRDADAVNADLIDGLVDGEEVDEIRAEGVLR